MTNAALGIFFAVFALIGIISSPLLWATEKNKDPIGTFLYFTAFLIGLLILLPLAIGQLQPVPDAIRYSLNPYTRDGEAHMIYLSSLTLNEHGNIEAYEYWKSPVGFFWHRINWQHVTEPRCFDPCDWEIEEIRRTG